MTTLIILVGVGLVVAAVLVSSVGRKAISGVCGYALEQMTQKNAKKRKILELISKKGKISNVEARSALGVSDRSVVRYMDALEREGKIKQVGKTGQSVFYILKK